MKKLLIAFLLLASMAGAQTLTVPRLDVASLSNSGFIVSASSDVTTGALASVSLSVVEFDPDSMWNGVGTGTIKVAGIYRVTFVPALYDVNENAAWLVKIYIDGSEILSGNTGGLAAVANIPCITRTLTLSAGQTISCAIQQTTGTGGVLGGATGWYKTSLSVVRMR